MNIQERNFEVTAADFEGLIEYFIDLVSKDFVKRVIGSGATNMNPNFWYKYLKAYKKWKKLGSNVERISRNDILINFLLYIKQIQMFESDWSENKHSFLKRLKKTENVQGLLFEFRTGAHFRAQGFQVKWVGCDNDKKQGDIEVSYLDKDKVVVECTIRDASIKRSLSDEILAEDLLKSVTEKIKGSYDWKLPRIVAVKVPEQVFWESYELRTKIERDLEKMYLSNEIKMSLTSAFIFMGEEQLKHSSPNSFRMKGTTDPVQQVLVIRNPKAKYPLPEIVDARLST